MTLPAPTPPCPAGSPAWDGDAALAGLDPDTAGPDPAALAGRDEPTDAELHSLDPGDDAEADVWIAGVAVAGPGETKQAPGWTLTQPQPGTLVWTTPHGRSYTVTPSTYLS